MFVAGGLRVTGTLRGSPGVNAESHGACMPGFFGYIGWATVCLVPWLPLVDVIFFAGAITTLPE